MFKQYKKILVAIDGSSQADLAFKKAVEAAKNNDATLHILNVIDTRAFQKVSSFDSKLVEAVADEAKEKIKKYYKNAEESGVKDVEYSIEYGSPKFVIGEEYPKKHDIDLIVLGATGLNAVERLLVGSVTEYVSRTAKCDVLITRK
ncbi:MAG: universal stress protein [Lactobacillus sp.]|nr:universal stress protein [Lactobacillus sp.]